VSVVVGIDLGTTNSAVAVPANADIPRLDALVEEHRLRRVGDALVIIDADRSPTTPSAVWVDTDGTVLVGMRAKVKARTATVPPAMFFKRDMGTATLVTAGHATLTPVEASAHVLRHLKALAEDVLAVPVERAVITVPAFFETQAKIDTTEAGRLAGLEVVETLIEPIAAAMTYAQEIRSALAEPRTFLVYDLGGGTFDTSIVTWDPTDGFQAVAFDGDRYLGGYDFDWQLVRWMRGELPGYDLTVDQNDPDGAAGLAMRASLLTLAEQAKHELSGATFTEIVSQHVTDRHGRLMNINLGLGRAVFEELIDTRLRQTLASCDRSLARARERAARAGRTLGRPDDVVLVGGSARIPKVAELLQEHLGPPPRLLHPDLAVAVGAALKAAAAPRRGGLLELDPPDPSFSPTDVTGRVQPGGPVSDQVGVTVLLHSDDGTVALRTTSGADGAFVIEDVPLRAGDNWFTVAVLGADGAEVGSQRLVVSRGGGQAAPDDAPPGDVLAHDFSIQLRGGMHPVALAGTMLPYRASLKLETATQGKTLRVQLFEGRVPVGEVQVDGLPPGLPVGTPVEVSLEFQVGWTIQADASVPSVRARASALINIPRREVPDWSRLRMDYEEARSRWAMRRAEITMAEEERVGPEIDELLRDVALLLDEGHDRAQTHYRLLEASSLVSSTAFSTGKPHLRPSLAEFEHALEEAHEKTELLARRDPAAAAQFRDAVTRLGIEGRDAYERDQPMAWAHINDSLSQRISALYGLMPDLQPTAAELLPMLLYELQSLDGLLRDLPPSAAAAQVDRLHAQLADISRKALAVNLDREQEATRQLIQLYFDHVRPLQAEIERLGVRIPEETIFLALRGGRPGP
jgi:actin-like ATPase involved in cell morphogenesis